MARQEEDYRERKTLSYLAYTIIAVNAGKKAPSSKEYMRKQKLDQEPELRYLWDNPLSKEEKQRTGSAEKAAAQLRKNEHGRDWAQGIPEETLAQEHVTEEERERRERDLREERREEWSSMTIADLQEYKSRKERGW